MPNKDGTGPFGKGPRTGRGLGKCQLKSKKKSPYNIKDKIQVKL